jgi:4-aminobutyrate aminotransferase
LAAKREIMSQWPPGAHGTTFGGNPVSCAAAIATLTVISDEGLLDNARQVGSYALERLSVMKEKYPCIGDVRGLGLMIGIEFVKEDGKPLTEGLKRILDHCLDKGLILIECGVDRNVIRLAPPLIVKKEDILEEAIGAIQE